MLANVVFPAFTAPYIAMLFFPYLPLVVLASEVAVYRFCNRSAGYWGLLMATFFSNAVSSIAGCVIAAFLPSGLVRKPVGDGHSILTNGPHFAVYAMAGFAVGLGLSILIEYLVICGGYSRAVGEENLLRKVTIANVVSYALLLSLALLSVKLMA